jgi:hypothetical protein
LPRIGGQEPELFMKFAEPAAPLTRKGSRWA